MPDLKADIGTITPPAAEIKAALREAFAAKASESDDCYPYCFGMHCARATIQDTLALGYSKEDIERLPEEVLMGLGLRNPLADIEIKSGSIVLDLGCGGGIDTFVAASKVGHQGLAIGIDMTEEMVRKARITAAHFDCRNIAFLLNDIEFLPLTDGSIDIIISNGTINMVPDKYKVFAQAYRVLKPRGSLILTDAVTINHVPGPARNEVQSWVDHLGGAIPKYQYLDAISDAGFTAVTILDERMYPAAPGMIHTENLSSIHIHACKPDSHRDQTCLFKTSGQT